MKVFECYTRGSHLIEAETADEARQIFADLVQSEPTSEFISAEEVEA